MSWGQFSGDRALCGRPWSIPRRWRTESAACPWSPRGWPAGRQASGHRTRMGSSRLQPGPWPPALALGCLSPRAGSRSCQGDRPEALTGQAPATCPLGTQCGRVGEPPGLSFPDCTVRETVILSFIQTRPLTGVQGRLLVSSWTDLGLWAAGGRPRLLEGPSLLLKWTWAQISARAPSDLEPKSSAFWASVSLPVRWG